MTFEDLRASAAVERSGQVRARSDRPSQRRNAAEPSATSRAVVRSDFTLSERKADTGPGTVDFSGVASVYERGYEMWDMFGPYTEIVTAGAAQDLGMDGLDVPLVLEHESLRRIARTTTGTLDLTQSDAGLLVHAPELDMADADVAYIVPKIRAGLVDEMSFKFLITDGTWSPDYTEYRINGFRIHRGDVAIVGYGANPYTSSSVRADMTPAAERVAIRLAPAPGELDARTLRI